MRSQAPFFVALWEIHTERHSRHMTGQWEAQCQNSHSRTCHEYTRFETYDNGASISCVMNCASSNSTNSYIYDQLGVAKASAILA